MSPHILLQNATILVPSGEKNDHVVPLRGHSLLIEDSKISKVSPNITPPAGAEIIDCTDKIVSPGFIDTHHHLWQTQLKGRHADHSLLEYMPNGLPLHPLSGCVLFETNHAELMFLGNMQSANFTPSDVFWGELGGCLEALDAGTTTVVDHAHMNISPAHSKYFATRSDRLLITIQLQMLSRRPCHPESDLCFAMHPLCASRPSNQISLLMAAY